MILSLNLLLIFITFCFIILKNTKNNIEKNNFFVKNDKKIRVFFIIVITSILILGNIHYFSLYYKRNENIHSSILIDYILGKN